MTNPSTGSYNSEGASVVGASSHGVCACAAARQCLPFLGCNTTCNTLQYISPLGEDGGHATEELLLPKRIFSVSLKEGFQSEQLFSCKAYHTNGKQHIWWRQRGDLTNLTISHPLLAKYLLAQCIKPR